MDFDVNGITVEALLAALDAARAALPPLPQPPTPQQGAGPMFTEKTMAAGRRCRVTCGSLYRHPLFGDRPALWSPACSHRLYKQHYDVACLV